jgi:MFS family permease
VSAGDTLFRGRRSPRARLAASGFWRRAFASLRNPNYRRFFVGQSISLVGTWMQSVAQSWLVLQLSGSGTTLGLVVAIQTLPVLLLSPYGGLIVDRADKRRLLLATQSTFTVLAATLGLLSLTHVVRLWMVIVIAAAFGLTNSLDNPARQAFVPELVGGGSVANAVSLNSVMTNAARSIGPALAGILIVTAGVGGCFLINAASFVTVLIALATMDEQRLRRTPVATHTAGQLVEGLRYVRRTPRLLTPLLMMALIGALSYEFQVVLPLLAKRTFRGDADAYGFLTASLGLGAVVGGIVVASRRPRGLRAVAVAAGAFGTTLLLAAAAPSFQLELVALALVGVCSVAFMSRGNTTLQLTSVAQMRGRVMALWAVAFIGTTPIGGPTVGYIAQHFGPRWGLALGGFAALAATALAVIPYYRHSDVYHPSAPGSDQLPAGAGPS